MAMFIFIPVNRVMKPKTLSNPPITHKANINRANPKHELSISLSYIFLIWLRI